MTVYLDIVLFENILLNYIIILSTAILAKQKVKFLKIIFSSTIGGIFAIVTYIINLPFLLGVIVKIFVSIIMMQVSFSECKVNKLIKILIFFYMVSFTFGGIAFMLLYFVNPEMIVINDNRFEGTYPLKITIIAGTFGFLIITTVAQIIKNRITKEDMICELEIFYNGKSKRIKTMLDTGNLLKEPISNADVIIVERDSLTDIFCKDILENISTILKGCWLETKNIYSCKLKIIPFSSLGNDNGLLVGFKPDYVKIYGLDEVVRNDIIIGIYNGKLTTNDMYTSLIGLNVFEKNKIITD